MIGPVIGVKFSGRVASIAQHMFPEQLILLVVIVVVLVKNLKGSDN
jgi:hypothetical protein